MDISTKGATETDRSNIVDYASTGAKVINRVPVDDGFSFPAEWQTHERSLMQFLPGQNWERNKLIGARKEWINVANKISEFEPLTLAINPSDWSAVEKVLSSQIDLVEFPLNDGWARDSGPMILTNELGDRCVAGFEFNGWGEKFPPHDDDALVKAHFAKHMGMDIYPADMVLEGGAVAFDGEGTLITTEHCLLNKNRNSGKSKADIETVLKNWLGVTKIIWLPNGLVPDPITDGHIDGIVAFAAPGVVLVHTTNDKNDANYAITHKAKQILQQSYDAKGRKLEVIEIPLTSFDVVHMNFYVCNGAVLVPVAGKASEDDIPLGIIRDAFPDREVVPIKGTYIAKGGGGIHCITQQVPGV